MAKYTKDDPDVSGLTNFDRASFENYMLDYNVDKNIETAKSADAMSSIKDVFRGGKLKVELKNPHGMYLMISTVLIGLAIILIVLLLLFFLIKLIIWLFKKDDISKLHWQISLLLVVFIVGMLILIYILTRLKDNVQTLLEKIVFKL